MWSSKHTINTLDNQLTGQHVFVAACLLEHFCALVCIYVLLLSLVGVAKGWQLSWWILLIRQNFETQLGKNRSIWILKEASVIPPPTHTCTRAHTCTHPHTKCGDKAQAAMVQHASFTLHLLCFTEKTQTIICVNQYRSVSISSAPLPLSAPVGLCFVLPCPCELQESGRICSQNTLPCFNLFR